MAPRDEDEHIGDPMLMVRPSDNVYSYFMFIGPTESKKDRASHHLSGVNWNIVMAYFLVALNFFMQGILLFLIFEEVVVENVNWQNGILKLGKDPVIGLFSDGPGKCNDAGALCFKDRGNVTCNPPTLQLVGRWQELDTNDDGIWTRSEVEKARVPLKCKYAVDPLEVFDVLVSMINSRSNLIWIHPDVKSGKAIHLPYFTYALGDVSMCGYRSEEMCGNLMRQGFFDSALKYGTAPRVGKTIDSALKYCQDMLMPGGTCERLLPSTYTVWKLQSSGECGSVDYEPFTYEHPANGVKKRLLNSDYSARQEYELAQDNLFRVFKGTILFTWLLLMLCEYKEVVKLVTLCMRFPDASEFGEEAVIMEEDPSDPEDVRFRIQGITPYHRRCMFFLCFVRTLVTCVLMVVGLAYLIKTNGYADLIMNGVALLFIAEVSSVLYAQVLRDEIKDQCQDIKALKVPMYGNMWLNRQPALVDIICVAALWVVVYWIMHWQLTTIVKPVHAALDCACRNAGPTCVEANTFNYDFWSNYWRHAVPGVYAEIAKLKASVPAAAASYLAVVGGGSNNKTNNKLEERVAMLEHENAGLEQRLEKVDQLLQSLSPSGMASLAHHPSKRSSGQKNKQGLKLSSHKV